jgi:general secretion pathway protein H
MRPGAHAPCARRRPLGLRRHARPGFTLIELMIVVALIALAAGVVSLALRDPAGTRLQTEAERLSALLESARAESRASGLTVSWFPLRVSDDEHFRFVGLPKSITLPTRWLDAQVSAEVAGGSGGVLLGPEPLIGAQRIVLRLHDQRVELATDGLGPFALVTDGAKP